MSAYFLFLVLRNNGFEMAQDHLCAQRTLVGLVDHVEPGDTCGATGRAQQRGQHPNRRGLAGSVRSEESEDLALLDAQVHAIDGLDLLVTGAEIALQTFGDDGQIGIGHRAIVLARDWSRAIASVTFAPDATDDSEVDSSRKAR